MPPEENKQNTESETVDIEPVTEAENSQNEVETIEDEKPEEDDTKLENKVNDHEEDLIEKENIEEIYVRSPILCEAPLGMCKKCYGTNLYFPVSVSLLTDEWSK